MDCQSNFEFDLDIEKNFDFLDDDEEELSLDQTTKSNTNSQGSHSPHKSQESRMQPPSFIPQQ